MNVLILLRLCATCVLIPLVEGRGLFRQQFIPGDRHFTWNENGPDPGQPAILTPLIEKGDIQGALKLSLVTGFFENITSYSGFFTVNKTHDSNLFFWFFPSTNEPLTDPILLWLQGGPGGSSLFGLFIEHGPFAVTADLKLKFRPTTWTSKYSMLYIDNPVGTGFSFTKDDAGYSTNQDEISENLYNALCQFFTLFSDLKKNDFYVTGESYAGKYVPSLSYWIHTHDQQRKCVNMKGIAIGDGLSDPPVMIDAYPDLIFNTGLIDENHKVHFQSEIKKMHTLLSANRYVDAFKVWDLLLNGDLSGPSYFLNVTGCTNYFNYLRCVSPVDFSYYPKFLDQASVRKAIHVGSLTYHSGNKVEMHLLNDFLLSVKPQLATIMNNYKVLLYSGQLDIIVGAALTERMLQNLDWKYKDNYLKAARKVWRIHSSDSDVAGYVRQVGNFTQAIVKGGGHILPFDQPERSFDMIQRFISGRGF